MAYNTPSKGLSKTKTILLILAAVIILPILFSFFRNLMGGSITLNQPINEQSYTFVSAVGNGNVEISETSDNTIKGTVDYKGTKPVATYQAGTFKIDSSGASSVTGDIQIPSAKQTDMELALGNGNLTLNARNLNVSNVEMSLGNGNLTYVIPVKGSSKVKLNLGNGNLDIRMPNQVDYDGISVRFEGTQVPDMTMGKLFRKVSDGYETLNYKAGQKNADIIISAGNAHISIEAIE